MRDDDTYDVKADQITRHASRVHLDSHCHVTIGLDSQEVDRYRGVSPEDLDGARPTVVAIVV